MTHFFSEVEDCHRLYKKLSTKSRAYLTALDRSSVADQYGLVQLIEKWDLLISPSKGFYGDRREEINKIAIRVPEQERTVPPGHGRWLLND